MQSETNTEAVVQEVEKKSNLHKITPLSKYLAMALFIILPFVGGWIGYQYAPEKVVEVEKSVEIKDESVIQSEKDEIEVGKVESATKVSYYPREEGPGAKGPGLLSWGSWSGRVNQVYTQDEKIYLLADRLEVYSGGGSCKSINGICLVNNGEETTLLELAEDAYLTLHGHCIDYEDDSNYLAFEDRRIKEDGLRVKTGCSVPFDSVDTLQLDETDYFNVFWFDFDEQGKVRDVVRQYFP